MGKHYTRKQTNNENDAATTSRKKEKELNSVDPDNECKQRDRSRRKRNYSSSADQDRDDQDQIKTKMSKARRNVTTVTVNEGDEVLMIATEAETSEFGSDYESGKQSSATQTESEDENEITFKQSNSNATVTKDRVINPVIDSAGGEELEDGECSFHQPDHESVEGSEEQVMPEQPSPAECLIDQKINASMAKFQTYMDEKFENMNRIAELERQLAANKQHLAELQAKG